MPWCLSPKSKLRLNDNNAAKPEGVHLMIGRRSYVSFGDSTGDRQVLEYTWAGDGPRTAMLGLHDDAKREYTYGPAQGLADSKGTFTQALYDEAKNRAGSWSRRTGSASSSSTRWHRGHFNNGQR